MKKIFKLSLVFFTIIFLSVVTVTLPINTSTYSFSIVNAQSATSQKCITQVGTPVDPSPGPLGCTGGSSNGPSGPCQQAPPPPDNIATAIYDKWGLILNIPERQLALAWEEFHEIDCTGFLQDLKGTLINTWYTGYAQQFSCPGEDGAQGATDIMFENSWDGEFMKAILVHELTHVWQFCSDRGEANLLEVQSAYEGEGGLTKYSRRECPDFAPGLDRIYHEDQADTIALYLNPEQGELTCGNNAPNPFLGGANPLHRAAAEKGVPKN